ncbi:MAG: hypothetical protein FD126_1856, partial [Elusimicrobia bacterium]
MTELLHHPSGPAFLGYFFAWFFCVLVVGRAMRDVLLPDRSGEPTPAALSSLEEPYFAAVLRGGEDEAERCASVALEWRGYLELGKDVVKVKKAAAKGKLHPLEEAVLEAAGSAGAPYLIPGVTSSGFVKAAEAKLRTLGLMLGAAEARLDDAYLWTVGFVALGPGVYRFGRGVLLGRPVLFLAMLLGVAFIALLVSLSPRRLTRAGERALRRAQERYAFLDAAQERGLTVDPADAALAAGLFGL